MTRRLASAAWAASLTCVACLSRAGALAWIGPGCSVPSRETTTGSADVQVRELTGPALLLTVGPAASGKSTLLRHLVAAGVVDQVVSSDAVRAERGLAPDETARAYERTRERVRGALAEGRVVAVDATNVRRRDRSAWLDVAADCGARAHAIRVGVGLDLEQLLARDAGRDRHVPRDAIAGQFAMARAITPESLTGEGFTVVDLGALEARIRLASAPAA